LISTNGWKAAGASGICKQAAPIRHEPYEQIVSRITAPVIGIWGEDDFVISIDDVRKLRGILEDHRILRIHAVS